MFQFHLSYKQRLDFTIFNVNKVQKKNLARTNILKAIVEDQEHIKSSKLETWQCLHEKQQQNWYLKIQGHTHWMKFFSHKSPI